MQEQAVRFGRTRSSSIDHYWDQVSIFGWFCVVLSMIESDILEYHEIDFLSTGSWQWTCAAHTERAHLPSLKPGVVALYTIAMGFRDRFSNHVHPCSFFMFGTSAIIQGSPLNSNENHAICIVSSHFLLCSIPKKQSMRNFSSKNGNDKSGFNQQIFRNFSKCVIFSEPH